MSFSPRQPRLLPQDSSQYLTGPQLSKEEWDSFMRHPAIENAGFQFEVLPSGHLGQVVLADQADSQFVEPSLLDLNTSRQPEAPLTQVRQISGAERSVRKQQNEDITAAETKARSQRFCQDPSDIEATCLVLLKSIAVLENEAPSAHAELAYMRERVKHYEIMQAKKDDSISPEMHLQTLNAFRHALNEGSDPSPLESGQIKPAEHMKEARRFTAAEKGKQRQISPPSSRPSKSAKSIGSHRFTPAEKGKQRQLSPPTSRITKVSRSIGSHSHKRTREELENPDVSDYSPPPTPCPKRQKRSKPFLPSVSQRLDEVPTAMDLTDDSDDYNSNNEESNQFNDLTVDSDDSNNDNENINQSDDEPDVEPDDESEEEEVDEDEYQESSDESETEYLNYLSEAAQVQLAIARSLEFESDKPEGQFEDEDEEEEYDETYAAHMASFRTPYNGESSSAGGMAFSRATFGGKGPFNYWKRKNKDASASKKKDGESSSAGGMAFSRSTFGRKGPFNHGKCKNEDASASKKKDAKNQSKKIAKKQPKKIARKQPKKMVPGAPPPPSSPSPSPPSSPSPSPSPSPAPPPPSHSTTGANNPLAYGGRGRRGGWSENEHNAIVRAVIARRQFEHDDPDEPVYRDINLFGFISDKLLSIGIKRTPLGCKNYWNRYGREESGFDEKRAARGDPQLGYATATSIQRRRNDN